MHRHRSSATVLLFLWLLSVAVIAGCGGVEVVAAKSAMELAGAARSTAREAADAVSVGNLAEARSFDAQASSLADQAREAAVEGSPPEQKAAGTAQADVAAVDAQVIALDVPTNVTGAETEARAVVKTVKHALCTSVSYYDNSEPPPTAEQWTAAIGTDLSRELGVSLDPDVLQEMITQVVQQTKAPIAKLNALISFDPTNAESYIQSFAAYECN